MKPYPISPELRRAIEALFDDPSLAYGPLGADRKDPDEWYVSAPDTSLSPAKRAALLKGRLEDAIKQMAKEHEELGSPEATDTLRMQGVGVLLALGQLWLHFPELWGKE